LKVPFSDSVFDGESEKTFQRDRKPLRKAIKVFLKTNDFPIFIDLLSIFKFFPEKCALIALKR
jgi:hypothetical protein